MSFSRGSGYALGWVHRHPERVLSLSIGDYPAREIRLPVSVAETLVAGVVQVDDLRPVRELPPAELEVPRPGGEPAQPLDAAAGDLRAVAFDHHDVAEDEHGGDWSITIEQ